MGIKIKLGEILRQFTENQDNVEVDGSTVGECLDNLTRQFPDIKKKLFDKNGILLVSILIDGETVYQKDLTRPVADGDKLHLILVVGGG